MMSDSPNWDAEQYLKFADHRLRPAVELLSRVAIESPERVVDLGCGAGNVTRLLRGRWPEAKICGVDSSHEMLAKARSEDTSIDWIKAGIDTWRPDDAPDVIYSNAALHWIADHHKLFTRLVSFLKPGGCLAVQMPMNWSAASHRLIRETLAGANSSGAPLGSELLRKRVGTKPVEEPEWYYDLLASCTRTLDIWTTEYLQILEGEDPVYEWVKGTALRPVLEELNEAERATFDDAYKQRLREAYPPRGDGRTVFPFRRLFLVAGV